jgi:disulfide bond formation protein DsbB
MMGSLYFSEVAGFVPCTLCWYQRILMYPLTLLLAIGLLRRDENLPLLVLPFSVLGLGFATYHYLLEKTNLFPESTACQAGVSCTTVWINWFGFATIPFLSLTGFLTITLMTVIAVQAGEPAGVEDAPASWLPVTGIVVLVLAAYFILAQIGYPVLAAADLFTVVDVGEPLPQSKVVDGTITPALASDQAEAVAHGAHL